MEFKPLKSFPSIPISLYSFLVTVSVVLLLYTLGAAIYNLFLHPLRIYPGPKLWAMSQIPFSFMWMSGSGHKKMLQLHEKYWDVDDMKGHRKRGQDENGKDPDFWRGDDKLTLVGSSRGRHGRLRKILSHGLSAQAMMAQQPTFQRHASLFLSRLKAASEEAVEITSWYNWTTFDIAGGLIFGEPFGCLEKSEYHPWVKLIFMHIKGIAFSTAVIRFPFANNLIALATPKAVVKDVQAHAEFTEAQVSKRLAFQTPRPDFMESMIKAHENGQASRKEVLANAHNLIVGSSETTATILSGITYLLATNKRVLSQLYMELRANFNSEEEIDIISVQRLEYMLAVVHEGLRIYPPVPSDIPRKTPLGGSIIAGNFVPPNPMFHSPKLFKDPESFVPERRLGDARFDNDQREAFQPFSVGPRNCIGKDLAYAEMRLLLARMIWNFDIELDHRSDGWLEKNLLYFL
ncbi:cytochrome P450 [Thozetella sp. PMI_491]|nr:cytochrome P450 [Thozetella sp. PMI_491]